MANDTERSEGDIALTPQEQWVGAESLDSVTTIESAIESMGLKYIGDADEVKDGPEVHHVEPLLLARIRRWDQALALASAMRAELIDLAIDSIGRDRSRHASSIDIDKGEITFHLLS